MLTPEQAKSFYTFFNSTKESKHLDEKTSALIALATSMAIGCYP